MNRRKFIKSAAIASGLIFVPHRYAKAQVGILDANPFVPSSGGAAWSPTNDGSNVKLWLESDLGSNTNGTWAAQAGNNCSWSNASLTTTTFGSTSKQVYSCNGSTTTGTIASVGSISQPFTIFWVFKYQGSLSSTKVMTDGLTTANQCGFETTSTGWKFQLTSNNSTQGTQDNSAHIITLIADNPGSQWKWQQDNGTLNSTAANLGSSGISDFTLASAKGGSFNAQMLYAAFIVRTGNANTDGVLANYITYLKRWGTY